MGHGLPPLQFHEPFNRGPSDNGDICCIVTRENGGLDLHQTAVKKVADPVVGLVQGDRGGGWGGLGFGHQVGKSQRFRPVKKGQSGPVGVVVPEVQAILGRLGRVDICRLCHFAGNQRVSCPQREGLNTGRARIHVDRLKEGAVHGHEEVHDLDNRRVGSHIRHNRDLEFLIQGDL